MIPYVILFSVITILSVMIEKKCKNPNKKTPIFLIMLSITILSLFAALRDYSIGIDIQKYGIRYFELSKCNTFKYFINSNIKHAEFLYLSFNYFISHIFNNYRVFLFLHQFFIASVVYSTGIKNRERMSFPLYVLSYLLIWYGASFNIIRQSIGMFILFYSFKYLEKKQYLKYYILNMIAILFHTSSYIGLLFPLLYSFDKYKSKNIWYFLISMILLISVLFFDNILLLLVNMGIIDSRYLLYAAGEKVDINLTISLIKLAIIFLVYVFDNKKENSKSLTFLKFMLIFEFIIYQISAFTRFGYRLSYVLLPFYIYTIAFVDKGIVNPHNKRFYRICIILLLISLWCVRHVFMGLDGIYPFKFWNN